MMTKLLGNRASQHSWTSFAPQNMLAVSEGFKADSAHFGSWYKLSKVEIFSIHYRRERPPQMPRRPYDLPSLSSLSAFEAAARHLSLTRAAAELNVTTGAISKHIKFLEGELGHRLFSRLHRALALTAEGETLSATLSDSFEKISSAFKQLKSAGDRSGV
jgi:hypothetical protein